MTLASGTKLGRYEIRSKIGEGGMGEVYRALDPKINREVAIKILPPARFTTGRRISRNFCVGCNTSQSSTGTLVSRKRPDRKSV